MWSVKMRSPRSGVPADPRLMSSQKGDIRTRTRAHGEDIGEAGGDAAAAEELPGGSRGRGDGPLTSDLPASRRRGGAVLRSEPRRVRHAPQQPGTSRGREMRDERRGPSRVRPACWPTVRRPTCQTPHLSPGAGPAGSSGARGPGALFPSKAQPDTVPSSSSSPWWPAPLQGRPSTS